MSTLFPPVPQPWCTVCLIKCESRQSQPGLTCTFYLSFCLSEEFKHVMNKGVVIWNIIPLHWWNYKDGESSQIMLIVFYHERCPCWGCGGRRKGRLWMNSDSTVRGLEVQHSSASVHLPVPFLPLLPLRMNPLERTHCKIRTPKELCLGQSGAGHIEKSFSKRPTDKLIEITFDHWGKTGFSDTKL